MCDYCGCRSRNLLSELGHDHDRIRTVAAAAMAAVASGDVAVATEAVAKLTTMLEAHSALEEGGLYPELSAEGVDVVPMVDDHAVIDDAVAAAGRGDTGAWEALPTALDRLVHHITAEEYDLFPAAHQILSDPAWDRIEAHRLAH